MRIMVNRIEPEAFARRVLEDMQSLTPGRALDTANGSLLNAFVRCFARQLDLELHHMLGNLTFDENALTDMDVQVLEGIWVVLAEIIDRKRKEAASGSATVT